MNIEKDFIPEMTIEQFADIHNLTMVIKERRTPSSYEERYYAYFKNCDVVEGCCLIGSFGNGKTPEEAIDNYADVINLRKIRFDAFNNQRDILVPRLIKG